ncbi:MAG: DUF5652 family protein [Chitinophagaceae bacterium]
MNYWSNELRIIIIFVLIWDMIWKLFALWKSAKNHQIVWFLCIGIFNTIGILPIIYLIIQKRKLIQ